MAGVIRTDILIYMSMIKDDDAWQVNSNPAFASSIKETTKNPSQISWPRRLNPGPPGCESRVLPRSHLARYEILLF